MERPIEGSQQPQNGQETPAEKTTANWTKIVGVFTGLLFATSAFSDYVIWRELRGNEEAARHLQDQQSAYFGIGTVAQIPSGARDASGKPSIGFIGQWQNLGGTRTKWAKGWISVQYFPDRIPYNFDLSRPAIDIGPGQDLVVGPNSYLQTNPVGIPAEDAVKAATGKGALLAWGAVEYADLFAPEITRHGRFCEKLVPSGKNINSVTKEETVMYFGYPYKGDCNKSE